MFSPIHGIAFEVSRESWGCVTFQRHKTSPSTTRRTTRDGHLDAMKTLIIVLTNGGKNSHPLVLHDKVQRRLTCKLREVLLIPRLCVWLSRQSCLLRWSQFLSAKAKLLLYHANVIQNSVWNRYIKATNELLRRRLLRLKHSNVRFFVTKIGDWQPKVETYSMTQKSRAKRQI